MYCPGQMGFTFVFSIARVTETPSLPLTVTFISTHQVESDIVAVVIDGHSNLCSCTVTGQAERDEEGVDELSVFHHARGEAVG